MAESLIQELQTSFAVIGAGPAGLAAAAAAAQFGLDGVLVEHWDRLGGQYGMAHMPGFTARKYDLDLADLRWRMEFLEKSNWRIIFHSIIERIDPAGGLQIYYGDRRVRIKFEALLAATGAREWVRPFLGWTLPGVFTTGAAVRLAVQDGIAPGRRVLVAGSGPLLLSSAAQLIRAKVPVIALVEATSIRQLLYRGIRIVFRSPGRFSQFMDDWLTLRRAKAPVLFGHGLLEAIGDERVSMVKTACLDVAGNFIPGSERRWEVDALTVSHGMQPDTRICRALGCDLEYDSQTGTYYAGHNRDMTTSCPFVYVAGEAAGIGGVRKALVEGEIAGLQVVIAHGLASAAELEPRLARLRRQRRKWIGLYRDLQAAFMPAFRIPLGLDPKTLVCRCEEVSLGALHAAFSEGDGTLRDLKLRTRFGMGICQGRMCETNVAHELAWVTRQSPDQIEPLRVRPPIEPIPLSLLAVANE